MARVALEHVDKVYPGGTRALSDCTLAVEDGELVVVVGPSGCGKSTVLRIVAGLETVTAGIVRIGDRIANDLAPQERNAAMVFQDYALYPYLAARGNLEFPLRMRRLARGAIRDRVEAIARLLDITGLLDRLPKQLSGGQRQRVAMGRALVREPAVFLLDEPLSNLDAKLRVQVRTEIKDLQTRTRTTMMYVTHDQTEAMTLGDRVVVLDRGRLQQFAPPAELYARPANTFVAGFIGSPPMNLFRADAIPLAAREAAVTAGVRPEAIDIVAEGGIPATVEHVEYLGHETLVHVRLTDEVRLVARVPGMRRWAPEVKIGIRVDPARLHRFDADGRALP